MKLRFFIFIVLSILSMQTTYSNTKVRKRVRKNPTNTTTTYHNQNVRSDQYNSKIRKTNYSLAKFFKPIKYSKSGVQCWLKHTYNDYNYSQKFLPFSLTHLEEFLTFTSNNEHPRLYIQSVLKLFTQKIKTTQFINAYAFSESVSPVHKLICSTCDVTLERKSQKQVVKRCLYSYLLKEFSTLKSNPDLALDNLSDQILDTLNNENNDITVSELQSSIKEFLELVLSKLIWDPSENQYIWPNVKEIAKNLEQYSQDNLLAQDALDELFWTLLSKFCYFIELNTPELPENFFGEILENINNEQEPLWSLPEQEVFITSKFNYLRKTLITSGIASKAYQTGLLAPVN